MYESKKYIGRKDFNKYHKYSFPRNFYNSSRYNHYKHSKYKYKNNYSNLSNKFDEEPHFKTNFEDKNHKNYRIYNEDRQTPFINKKKFYGKENYSLNSNWNVTRTRMKTKDVNENSEKNGFNSDKNKGINNKNNWRSNMNKDCDEFLIKDKEEEEEEEEDEEENDEEINDDKTSESLDDNLNNINFNISEFNIEKAINDLLQKNSECNLTFNNKENIFKDFQKYIHKAQIPFKENYEYKKENNLIIPRNINNFDDMLSSIERRNNSLNCFNFLNTTENPLIDFSLKNNNNSDNNFGINNNNFSCFQNNPKNNIDNFNISFSSNQGISSFNLFDPNILNIKNNPNLPHCLSNNNYNSQNIRTNPFNNLMTRMDLNQCILKTAINNHNLSERNKENTDILEINVKISKTKTLTFKIRRYDDMFRTVKIFCEINKLDIKLIRPLIIYIIKALNSIYGIYNLYLKPDEIEFLKELKRNFYSDDENRTNDIDKNDNEKEDD